MMAVCISRETRMHKYGWGENKLLCKIGVSLYQYILAKINSNEAVVRKRQWSWMRTAYSWIPGLRNMLHVLWLVYYMIYIYITLNICQILCDVSFFWVCSQCGDECRLARGLKEECTNHINVHVCENVHFNVCMCVCVHANMHTQHGHLLMFLCKRMCVHLCA